MNRRSGGLDHELWRSVRASLQRAMVVRGWSMRRLARESGVSSASVSTILREGSIPTPQTLSKLALGLKRVRPDPAMVALLRDAEALEAELQPATGLKESP